MVLQTPFRVNRFFLIAGLEIVGPGRESSLSGSPGELDFDDSPILAGKKMVAGQSGQGIDFRFPSAVIDQIDRISRGYLPFQPDVGADGFADIVILNIGH